MLNQEALNKRNFLTWYEIATPEDKEIAKLTDNKKYEKLLQKYKYEVEGIIIRKSLSLPENISP